MMSYRIEGLTSATELANSNSEHSQAMYSHHYNLRSRDKRFVEGDTVIVLDVDASSKTCRRWQGPATVFKVKMSLQIICHVFSVSIHIDVLVVSKCHMCVK